MLKLKLNENKLFVTIFLILITIVIMNPKATISSTDIISVSHQPSAVSEGMDVTVEISFNDDTNVTGIQIQYCALEPDYICHFPKTDMTSIGDNSWSGTFTVVDEAGTIGYELYISLANDSTIIAPDSSDFLGLSNIAEPIAGTFYFTITLSTTNSAPLNIGLVELAITFGIIVIVRNSIMKKR